MLPSVARSASVSAEAGPKYSTNFPTTPFLRRVRDGEDDVGARRALAQLAVHAHADDLRDQHRHRLAEHRRLGLDPADAPAQTPSPLIIVVCESVPTTVSGRRAALPAASDVITTRARYSRFT
jgi:hypothetical protein